MVEPQTTQKLAHSVGKTKMDNTPSTASTQTWLQKNKNTETDTSTPPDSDSKGKDKSNDQPHKNLIMATNLNQHKLQVRKDETYNSNHDDVVMSRQPTPIENGQKATTIKEKTINWVQRSLGMHKEHINVTLNHSCKDIPSQIFVKSPELDGKTTGSIQQMCFTP